MVNYCPSLYTFVYRVGQKRYSQKIYNDRIAEGDSPREAEIKAWRFYGGDQQAMFQTELQFPLVKEAGIMGVVFYDIGMADEVMKNENFFADMGFGIRWFSPIGPLRFEWGFPLDRDPDYNENSVFEFSIGTPF